MTTKQHSYTTVSLKEARANGYRPLTYDFSPKEYHMMQKVINDMRRTPDGATPIDYVLVVEDEKHPNNICVYRKNISG